MLPFAANLFRLNLPSACCTSWPTAATNTLAAKVSSFDMLYVHTVKASSFGVFYIHTVKNDILCVA